MRILGIASSDVHGGNGEIPEEDRYPAAFQRALAQSIAEPVEITARAFWPNPGSHVVVRRWLDEVRPELVSFSISSFWFLYESTPVKFERRFGGPGRFINRQSQRIAATPWMAHNRFFQWSRKGTQRALGGQAWFEPEEVIATAKDVIREVLRSEGSYLVVTGPGTGERWAADELARRRAEARRVTVDGALASFCRGLHVEYVSSGEMDALRDPGPRSLQADELHLDRGGHRRVAERYFETVLGWVQRAQEAAANAEAGKQPAVSADG